MKEQDPELPYVHPAADGDESESSIPGSTTQQDPDPEPADETDATAEEA